MIDRNNVDKAEPPCGDREDTRATADVEEPTGLFVAEQLDATQSIVDTICGLFILLRLIYGGLYILDRPTLRTICWCTASACPIALFVLAAQ